MVSAYRMHLKNACYTRIRGTGLVRNETCPLLPVNEWLEARIEAAQREPATVYPVVDANVRCFAALCFFCELDNFVAHRCPLWAPGMCVSLSLPSFLLLCIFFRWRRGSRPRCTLSSTPKCVASLCFASAQFFPAAARVLVATRGSPRHGRTRQRSTLSSTCAASQCFASSASLTILCCSGAPCGLR